MHWSVSSEHAATQTMRSTHRLDRLLTGTACRVGHRTPSSATVQQAAILCHVSSRPLPRLSAAWRGRRSSAQHRLAIADARGARGFKSQCQRAPRLLLAFVFCTFPARMTTYFVDPTQFPHAPTAGACGNRVSLSGSCGTRPGEVQNSPSGAMRESGDFDSVGVPPRNGPSQLYFGHCRCECKLR